MASLKIASTGKMEDENETNINEMPQSNSSTTPIAPTNGQTDSAFFFLPPEIRNIIYRYCLVQKGTDIYITSSLTPHPLLSTCRQIRTEALRIWYLENKFVIVVQDCDAGLYRAYVRAAEAITGIKVDYEYNFEVELIGLHWDNLLDWCHAVWDGELHPAELVDNVSDLWTVALAALNIADKSKTLP